MDSREMQYEQVLLEAVQLYASEQLPAGVYLHRGSVEVTRSLNHVAGDLVAYVRAFVYGQTGDPARVTIEVEVANFPRWVPRRVRRWLTKRQPITFDTTPLLVYPDAVVSAELGRPVQVMRHSGPWTKLARSSQPDANQGWY